MLVQYLHIHFNLNANGVDVILISIILFKYRKIKNTHSSTLILLTDNLISSNRYIIFFLKICMDKKYQTALELKM